MSAERAARFVEAAHAYAELGWALVRCDGKDAKEKGWQHNKPEAPQLVAGKWSHWGQRWNLGVVCGPSGVAVLDVDRDDDPDAACLELLGAEDLPLTPIVRTGRGRLQVYYRDPGGLAKHARDGFELRVGPHQCIAPPSEHPDTGRAYEWLAEHAPWEIDLAPLPAHLIDYFAASANGSDPREVPEIIGPGERHDFLFSIAGSLRRRGLGAGEILATLRAVNAERCRPPHEDAKLEELAQEIMRYAPAAPLGASYIDVDPGPVSRPPHLDSDAPATSPDDLAATSPEGDLATSPHPLGRGEVEHLAADLAGDSFESTSSWLPIDIVTAAANPPAPPEILALFYLGLFHLVSGESEAMKTWLLLAAAAAELATGNGVVWVDGDDVGKGALLERLRLFGVADETISDLFAYMLPSEPIGGHMHLVLDAVKKRGCRLAVLDGFNPLLELHGLDPNVGVEVERFYKLIDPIRKQGVAVVLTDNVVKSREGRDGWAIGSERKRSKAEVHLGMRALEKLVRGGKGRAKIDVQKDRPGHLVRPSPGLFVVENGSVFTWRIQPDDSHDEQGGFRPTAIMGKVSWFLEARADDPQSRNQIEEAKLGGREYVRLAIDKLIEEGFASEFSGPRGARLVRFEKAFREDDQVSA